MWIIPNSLLQTSALAPECCQKVCESLSDPSESDRQLVCIVSGKAVRRPLSWRGWKRRQYVLHLSGAATLRRSVVAPGVDALTSSLRATRSCASPSRQPVNAVGAAILATFGRRCVASLQEANPASCSSKTSMVTSRWGCGKSFGISKDSATRLRQACSRRRKWARRTFASGCLSSGWPTAAAMDSTGARNRTSGRSNPSSQHHDGETLGDAMMQWATPNVPNRGPESKESKESKESRGSGGIDVQTQAANWPTASARDCKGAPTQLARPDGKSRLDQLDRVAEYWTSPSSRPPEPTTDDGLGLLLSVWTRPSCPRLSPAFQWWLMGWPHPRTCFGSEATGSCPSAPHGPSSTSGPASWNRWKNRQIAALCSLLRECE